MRSRNFGVILILLSLVMFFHHQELAEDGWLNYSPMFPVAGGILFLLDYWDYRKKASLRWGFILCGLAGIFAFLLYR